MAEGTSILQCSHMDLHACGACSACGPVLSCYQRECVYVLLVCTFVEGACYSVIQLRHAFMHVVGSDSCSMRGCFTTVLLIMQCEYWVFV